MCLPDFKEFVQIDKNQPLVGYRNWRNNYNNNKLISEYQDYNWKKEEGPHKVKDKDSGIYAYNNYNNDNYHYHYLNYNNYYNNDNYHSIW